MIALFFAVGIVPIPVMVFAGVTCSGGEACWAILSTILSFIVGVPVYYALARVERADDTDAI